MSNQWRRENLPAIMADLARRPGHENTRTLIADILRNGFGIAWTEIDHEVRLPRVHGRIDTMFAGTVFEFKRDLRQELGDVERKMPDYLAERGRQSGRKFIGVATDGATFIAYELAGGDFRASYRQPGGDSLWFGVGRSGYSRRSKAISSTGFCSIRAGETWWRARSAKQRASACRTRQPMC